MAGESPGRPAHSRFRRALRLAGWNALILFALFVFAVCGAEIYFRVTIPFRSPMQPVRVIEGVGLTRQPHAAIRHTNGRDFWQVSRANSLGFVDQEPPGPERAAASCHVTLIGDSFVEALEVPIVDKAQVRLEELAARELPDLDVTTSAFGYSATGQINQLPIYDAFARPLSPDLVVLVAYPNDFRDNSAVLTGWFNGWHPDWLPFLYARPGAGGEMEFLPPSSPEEVRAHILPSPPARPESAGKRMERMLRERSYLADWLWNRYGGRRPWRTPEHRLMWAEIISRDPRFATFREGWDPGAPGALQEAMLRENPPPIFREALDVTRFALEQFRERTGADGAALAILAVHAFGDGPATERLRGLAASVGNGIPVISQYDHVIAGGGEIEDLHWAANVHWNATGHRLAAEAILEWLKRNPEVCD